MKSFITTLFAFALSFSAFAQQNDTMFVHTNQFIHEFATQEVDSIVFYRTQARMTLPKDTVTKVDSVVRTDTVIMTVIPPRKTQYDFGEKFDITGLKVFISRDSLRIPITNFSIAFNGEPIEDVHARYVNTDTYDFAC
jgi:hypothetical protein